jgi:aspartyl-tRNA(Asn)/glutamyl-tRNA(Gln) amidotransferase subunit C
MYYSPSMSAPLSHDEVNRIAALANLALTDRERDLFARQLADILEYAAELRQVDTSGVPPTSHALAEETLLRADEPVPCLPRADALANAPDAAREAGLFKVPRVIGG